MNWYLLVGIICLGISFFEDYSVTWEADQFFLFLSLIFTGVGLLQ